MDISFVIPFIHEYPSIYSTVNNIQTEMKDSPYSWEIIVAENGVVDPNTEKAFTGQKALYRALMGDKIRYVFEPRQCGPVARNAGARIAKGKCLLFLDAHSTLGKDSIEPLFETLENNPECGCISGLTSWSNYNPMHLGAYYELFGGHGGPTLPTHMHGHYMPHGRVKSKSVFKAVMGSQAYTMYRREEFWMLGGYFEGCRFYPHPEGYMPLKVWMTGQEVWICPDSWHIHGMFHRHYQQGDAEHKLEQVRNAETIEEVKRIINEPTYDEGHQKRQEYGGLSWHQHGIRNVLMVAYILGDEKWLNICKDATKASDVLAESAVETVEKHGARKQLRSMQEMTLDEVLIKARLTNKFPATSPDRIWGMEKFPKNILGSDPLQ